MSGVNNQAQPGGVQRFKTQADQQCEVCKIEYGDVDATNHKNTEIRGATDPTCCEAGYTGDKWCTDCNTKIESGSEISLADASYDPYMQYFYALIAMCCLMSVSS